MFSLATMSMRPCDDLDNHADGAYIRFPAGTTDKESIGNLDDKIVV